MEPTGAVLRCPGLLLHVDAAGTAAVADGPSSVPWLEAVGDLDVTTATGRVDLGAPQVRVDADEVEVERWGGGLRTVVRHAVDQAWVVRVVLANETDADVVLTRVRLGWRAAPGTVVTALAAGAEAAYAVQVADGDGPLLVGRLRAGAQADVDETGFVLDPPVLGPGHRWAAQWRLEVVPDARRAHLGADLPPTTWFEADQTAVLAAGPDVAVVADDLAVEVGEDHVEVHAAAPGPYTVELRSARGTTAYGLAWAPDLDDLVDAAAGTALGGPTSPAGTARLDGAVVGLVVQDALDRRTAGPPDAATDAVELLAGRLVERLDDDPGGLDAFDVAFLAREADRTGAVALLDAATAGLRALDHPSPGVGLAGAAVVLGHVRAGRPPARPVAHLAALRAAFPADEPGALELALLLRPRHVEAPSGAALLPDVGVGLRRLGAWLGAGLPGRVVPAVAVDRVAHAAVVLGLVDEAAGQRLARAWGVPAAELARRCAAEARARVEQETGDGTRGSAAGALAWLVLGGRVGR